MDTMKVLVDAEVLDRIESKLDMLIAKEARPMSVPEFSEKYHLSRAGVYAMIRRGMPAARTKGDTGKILIDEAKAVAWMKEEE